MHRGYIKLWRKTLDSIVFENASIFKLWILCLVKANWRTKQTFIPGTIQPLDVPRGSFITGKESLHLAMFPPRRADGTKIRYESLPTSMTVWRWLKALEQCGCLKLKNLLNRATLVTLCNYELYQDDISQSCSTDVTPTLQPCSTDVTPTFTTKEGEELKEPQEGGGAEKSSGAGRRFSTILIPPEIDTPEFRLEWEEWEAHQREKGTPLTKGARFALIERLQEMGAARAIAALRHSRSNNYKGLVEPTAPNGQAQTAATNIEDRKAETEAIIARQREIAAQNRNHTTEGKK